MGVTCPSRAAAEAEESIDLPVPPASPLWMLVDGRMFQMALAAYVYACESHPCSEVPPFGIRKSDSVMASIQFPCH